MWSACAEDPWVLPQRDELTVGGEVYRVFCKRTAAESFPKDMEGYQFGPACEGRGMPPAHEARLDALLERRERLVAAIDRILGDDTVMQEQVIEILAEDEIKDFLTQLIPLYDPPDELLPGTTRALGDVIKRLITEDDETGSRALTALSRITGRQGYRKLELSLGLIRSVLSYRELDTFTEAGIKLISREGEGADAFDEVVRGLALEMANYDPAPLAADSTLILARDLLLSPLGETPERTRDPIWVTRRDARGVALPRGGVVGGPFVDVDPPDGMADIDGSGRLVSSESEPGFEDFVPGPFTVRDESEEITRDNAGRLLLRGTQVFDDFDAQPTMLAGFLREDARLVVPADGEERTPLEKLGRGLPALLGMQAQRTVTYGNTDITFDGFDPTKGPLYDLVHALGALAKHPDEMRRMLQAVETTLVDDEAAMAGLVDAMLKINERGKQHDEAVLQPERGADGHRFWDDLIQIGVRITNRPGMLEALIRMILHPDSVGQGPLLGNWMRYNDVVTYEGAPIAEPEGRFSAEDAQALNAPIEHTYERLVDRSMRDVGENRSIWQRTMSMVHALRNQKQCNKEGATLGLTQGAFAGLTIPLLGGGYVECDLFLVPDMTRVYSQAVLEKAEIVLKPSDLQLLGQVGIVDLGQTQADETQITGFDASPTPESFSRFIFGPPNLFTRNMVDPAMFEGVAIRDLEPYGLFPMEVRDPMAKPKGGGGDGLRFIDAGRPMMEAFDTYELIEEDLLTGDVTLPDGYMFAELLHTFHMHWGSRSDEPCNGPPEPTCTQSMDPAGRFFSYQTDLRSYEQLISEAFIEERFIEVLHDAAQAMAKVNIDGKDGITILAEFVEIMLKADPALTYRDGRASAKTNVGEEVGYVSPLYLVLDGLKQIDKNFEEPEHEERLETWREARSELVDLFLTVEEVDGQKRLKDRIGHAVALKTVRFLRDRITAHADAGDIEAWGNDLAPRLVRFLDTPLIAGLLHLFDKAWVDRDAGRELMRLVSFIVNEDDNPEGFEQTLVAAADLLQLLEDTEKIAPLLDLGAEAIAPGVTAAVDQNGGDDIDVDTGIARRAIELQKNVLELHTLRPSTLSKVLRNAVSDSMGDGSSPLEALIDAIAELEREDPSKPSTAILSRDDLERIATSAHTFLTDKGRGIERLYDVIQNRKLGQKQEP